VSDPVSDRDEHARNALPPSGSEDRSAAAAEVSAPRASAVVASAVKAPSTAVDRRTAYALAFATGTLYFLGFAGTDIWPCALVALAPMVVAMDGQTPRRCLEIGAIAGFTMNMMGFYWLYGMLKTFSGFPGPICLVFMSLLCAYQGGRIALFGWLAGRARQRGWPGTLSLLLAFAASELLYPLLFPWYFAASVHQVPVLSQLGEVGGPYIVGLVLAAPSLALAELLLARRKKRPFSRGLVFAGLATPLVASLIGLVRIAQVDARMLASEPVHVGIVQGNMPLLQKRDDHVESLRRHVRMTEELRQKGADFAVWSESAVMWNIPEDDYDRYLQFLFTRRLGIPALFGALLIGRDAESRRAYNVALATDAEGRVTGRYDKHYLLAFGEYIPFGETFPILYQWSPNSGHLTPGKSIEPVTLAGHPVSALVCYEDILPSFVNNAVNHGRPEMIVNVTNDAWFGDTTEPWIHLALAKMRAIEHRRYLLRSTNSGVSAVIDPVGRVVAHSGTYREETVDAVAHWMKGPKTIYEIVGDVPWWLLAVAIVAMAFYRPPARWRLAS
jgi:apolipoprotein N-acyltransferase